MKMQGFSGYQPVSGRLGRRAPCGICMAPAAQAIEYPGEMR